MSRIRRFAFIVKAVAAVALLAPSFLSAQGERGAIVVEITGFRNSNGKAGVLLFSREKGFPADHRQALESRFAEIVGNACRVTLEDIPYGNYAVSVFHDENGDGALQLSMFGIPREGVGASRNPAMRFGPPRFRDARFTLDSPEHRLAISMRYPGKRQEPGSGNGGAGK
jgi:uncharacterized protein (DUF2141 family)